MSADERFSIRTLAPEPGDGSPAEALPAQAVVTSHRESAEAWRSERMKSPQSTKSGMPHRKITLASLIALAAVLTAGPALAQSTTAPASARSDSVVAASPDSAVADTVRSDGVRSDSARTDSARRDSVRTDSAGVPSVDSLARRGADTTARAASAVPSAAPVDSALGAACEQSAQGPPDVLLVTFRPSTTESERSAVALEVGGTVLGMSQYAPGAWYLQVPGSAYDPAVADRLILLPPVLEVESTRCTS